MPTFKYSALTDEGKKAKGFIEADSKARAFTLLQDKGLMPLNLTRAKGDKGGKGAGLKLSSLLPSQSIRLGESFFYLALMLQSGSSLAEGLDLLGRMSSGKAGEVWLSVRDSVESGSAFSKALAAYPRQFPGIYIGMVQVAEQVGKLGEVLEKVAEYEEQRSEVTGRLLTALVYPAVIALVGAGAVYFLLSRVLPSIAKIFTGADQALPTHTQFLLELGTALQDLGILVFIPPLLLILGGLWAYRSVPAFRLRVDALGWRIPLLQKAMLARFSGMLGFQLTSGIPLVQALDNASEAIGSSFFKEIIKTARHEVSGGKPLDRVLASTGQFPELYIVTLSTGQKSGKLGIFLNRLARVLEMEVDNILKRIMALLEPLLILAVGLTVGFIVMAVMGPIFEMTTLVR